MSRRAGRLVGGTAFTLLLAAQAGCAASPTRPSTALSTAPSMASQTTAGAPADLHARQAEWTRARQLLSLLRLSEPAHPYVAELTVALHERVSGRGFGARGALAVDPHRALRLVLLGPGGTTALDLWVTPTRFRLVVPSMDLVKRGGTSTAGTAGLPVAFFRWWFLGPLDGRLLDAHLARATGESSELYVRASDGATVWMREGPPPAVRPGARGADRPGMLAIRRVPGDVDRSLEWSGSTLFPHPGDVARYREEHPSFGIDVTVRIDALGQAAPDPAAFDDPDVVQPEVSL